MPSYHQLGQIPHKRHTQFRRPDGGLYAEEVFGTEGFHGIQSILYHLHPPTQVSRIERAGEVAVKAWDPEIHRHHLFKTRQVRPAGDPITGRQVLCFNQDVAMALVQPVEPMAYFYRNGRCDELYFVHEGYGQLRTMFGRLPFRPGDYLVIPRGTTYQLELAGGGHRFLWFEAHGPVETPRRYRNEYGQLLEHAPFCERDIRRPLELETHDETGDYEVRLKVGQTLMAYHFGFHPFDVVGWDGYLYPWAFNVEDFEPITGRVHQPPPVHQTFQGPNFVVCSFVPRRLDYHPAAIPVPYSHSNIDSDELIYYVAGQFGSRRGVELAAITLHPAGIPHGPQPGAVEANLGKEATDELAVMIDTFRPLTLTTFARACDDPSYVTSWMP